MTMKRKKNVPKKVFLTEQVNSIIQNKYPVKCKCQDICGTFQNICHVELANPLTKRTLLVIWQIQDMFNTSRNKSSSLVLKPCKSIQKTNEEVFSLKLDRQLDRYIYRDLMYNSQQKLYLSRITKFRFPDLFFTHIQVIYVGFLFSQLQTYITIILRVIKGDVR